MMRNFLSAAFLSACVAATPAAAPADTAVLRYVDPFIGTTNFGTTNPGALVPNGLMSVSPFNVTGSDLNRFDKDARWWSTPLRCHQQLPHRIFTRQSQRSGLPGAGFCGHNGHDRSA